MNILVFSDSHSSLRFMRRCAEVIHPHAIVHLGDYFDDGDVIREEYPGIPFYQVPGNCDRYRCPPGQPEILITRIFGVDFYMTHGHRHSVKSYLSALIRDARTARVAAVLYGHTHIPDLHQEEDGLWVVNPGSSRGSGGSAALICCETGAIREIRLLREEELY